MELLVYILYTQIFNIHEYETFINMFILSLKRLTSSRSEGVWFFTACNTNIHVAFLYEVKQREAK